MIELYHAMHSTCSQKVRICLFEKDLPWKEILVNLATNEHLDPAYLRLNPNGVVPTLVHDGEPVLDSSVICEYLDETFPGNPLVPRDALGRARLRTWLRYLEEVPTASIRVPSFNSAFLYRFEGLSEQQFREQQADLRPLRKHFYRRMGARGFNHEDVEASIEQLSGAIERMEAALIHGPWIMGEMFTLADIVVAPVIDRMADLGLDHLWRHKNRPRVTDWYRRIQARPSFQKAFPKGARLSEFLKIAPLQAKLAG